MKTIAIIGATGKVARHATQKALEQGFRVHALARQPDWIEETHEHLHLFQGDVRDVESLKKAIMGADFVLSCIGNRSKDKGVVIELGTRNIIQAMEDCGVGRMALISSVGVGESTRQLSALGIRGWIFGVMFFTVMNALRKDLLAAERVALDSSIRAIVVRPVELTKAPGVGRWIATDHHGQLGGKIAREDVGHFMVTLTEDTQYDNTAVSLGSVL